MYFLVVVVVIRERSTMYRQKKGSPYFLAIHRGKKPLKIGRVVIELYSCGIRVTFVIFVLLSLNSCIQIPITNHTNELRPSDNNNTNIAR